jgi:hypothetical protein
MRRSSHADASTREPGGDEAMASALQGLRDGSPWHLMLGLDDRAAQLIKAGHSEAGDALDEAETLAESLGARGVLAQVSELRAQIAAGG